MNVYEFIGRSMSNQKVIEDNLESVGESIDNIVNESFSIDVDPISIDNVFKLSDSVSRLRSIKAICSLYVKTIYEFIITIMSRDLKDSGYELMSISETSDSYTLYIAHEYFDDIFRITIGTEEYCITAKSSDDTLICLCDDNSIYFNEDCDTELVDKTKQILDIIMRYIVP